MGCVHSRREGWANVIMLKQRCIFNLLLYNILA